MPAGRGLSASQLYRLRAIYQDRPDMTTIEAAAILGISRQAVWTRLRQMGIRGHAPGRPVTVGAERGMTIGQFIKALARAKAEKVELWEKIQAGDPEAKRQVQAEGLRLWWHAGETRLGDDALAQKRLEQGQ
jgi:hypothetical protein